MLRNLSISPKKWTNLILELSEVHKLYLKFPRFFHLLKFTFRFTQLCSSSNSKEAVNHIFEQAAYLVTMVPGPSGGKDILGETDLRRISKALGRLHTLQLKPRNPQVNPRLFKTLVARLSEKERNDDLLRAFQSLPYANAKLARKKAALARTGDSEDIGQELMTFIEHSADVNSLPTYLVLLKLLLCLWEEGNSAQFASSMMLGDAISASQRLLAMYTIPDTTDLKAISCLEESNEQLQSFESAPRILLNSGHPSKLSTFEVQGKAVGVVAGVSVVPPRAAAGGGPQDFEATLKGRGFAGIKVGWALCGADLGGSNTPLGSNDEAWVFEGFSEHFFHNATELSRARRISIRSNDSTCTAAEPRRSIASAADTDDNKDDDGDGKEENSLFSGLFNESEDAGDLFDGGSGASNLGDLDEEDGEEEGEEGEGDGDEEGERERGSARRRNRVEGSLDTDADGDGDADSLLSHLLPYSDGGEATSSRNISRSHSHSRGHSGGGSGSTGHGAQAFLDFMREEDRGMGGGSGGGGGGGTSVGSDVGSVRRGYHPRHMLSAGSSAGAVGSASHLPLPPPASGWMAAHFAISSTTASATGASASAGSERAESRASNAATAAMSETSEHSFGSSAAGGGGATVVTVATEEKEGSRDGKGGSAGKAANTLQLLEKSNRNRAALKAGGVTLDPVLPLNSASSGSAGEGDCDGGSQHGGGDREDAASNCSNGSCWSAGSVLGCLLLPASGEMRFFLDGACVGAAPVRLPASRFAACGVCPVFSCNPSAGLEINIGQAPYKYEREVLAHLECSPAAAPSSPPVTDAAGAALPPDSAEDSGNKKKVSFTKHQLSLLQSR